MEGSLDRPPITVRASRTRGVGLAIGSAIFVALIGMSGLGSNRIDTGLVLSIAFFVLCGAVGLALIVWPAKLEIGPAGIIQKALWRTTRYAWTDIYDFRATALSLTSKAVGFNYLNGPPKRSTLRKLNSALVGVQGTLQPGLGSDPAALANLLNQARERWLETPETAVGARVHVHVTPATGFSGLSGARMSRRTYWIVVGVFLTLVVGLSIAPGVGAGTLTTIGRATTVPLIWVFARRLHDIGRSGWWQAPFYVVQILAVVAAAVEGGPASLLAFGLQLIFTAVLGAIPGTAGDNKFGPAPGQPTPAAQSEVFR